MADDLPEQSTHQSEGEWAARVTGYIERALLITLGATVTVLAGFLSQVWGSASVAFRTDLAISLKSLATLFIAAFALPGLRFLGEAYEIKDLAKAQKAFQAWALAAVAVFIAYMLLADHLGDTILTYAKMAPPKS